MSPGPNAGYQIYVEHRGHVLTDVASGIDGRGRPVRPDTLFALYCAGKPLIAAAIALLVQERELSWADRISDVVPELRGTPSGFARVADLLNHSAEIPYISANDAVFGSSDQIERAVRRVELIPLERSRRAYSRYTGWHILGTVLERLGAEDYRTFIRQHVSAKVRDNVELRCGFLPGEMHEFDACIGVHLGATHSSGEHVPALLEHSAFFGESWNPAFGTYGSARGLGHFYSALLSGGLVHPKILREMIGHPTSQRDDFVLRRACRFGFGFLLGPWEPLESGRGRSLFGYASEAGCAFAFADPTAEMVASIVLVGMDDGMGEVSKCRSAIERILHESIRATADNGRRMP